MFILKLAAEISAVIAAIAAVLMVASHAVIDAMVFIYQYFNIGAQ